MNSEQIAEQTLLSEREAELYLHKVRDGLTLEEAASKMGITPGTAKGKWGRINAKIQKAEATVNLESRDLTEQTG